MRDKSAAERSGAINGPSWLHDSHGEKETGKVVSELARYKRERPERYRFLAGGYPAICAYLKANERRSDFLNGVGAVEWATPGELAAMEDALAESPGIRAEADSPPTSPAATGRPAEVCLRGRYRREIYGQSALLGSVAEEEILQALERVPQRHLEVDFLAILIGVHLRRRAEVLADDPFEREASRPPAWPLETKVGDR